MTDKPVPTPPDAAQGKPLKLHFTNEWLRRKIAEEPDDASCEAGILHPEAPIPDGDLRKIINGQRAIIERLRQERDDAYTALLPSTTTTHAESGLREALLKLRSYNQDIHEGKINYRPMDHIYVIDKALAEVPRTAPQVAMVGDALTVEQIAKAIKPSLFSDDLKVAHQAASPWNVESARATILKEAANVLALLQSTGAKP